ncbi:hypothetical protein [Microbacterium rhizomatis]|uniref:Uncharacterized protein n=1 Tax=Microbacterium rhizomatis TaxID=1631477 RepID=A0A5J5J0Z5_9MICO|nr:hypothetical protein [Microbacterium rhizomatis]KAA9106333.1 hypothetical protein F6B43_14330 [Microbacterium rhizomatis]
MSRTLNVVRLQLVNRQTYIWVPLLILAGSWVLTLVVFSMIPYDGAKYGGGAQAPLWYFMFVGVQALTLSFPFSQALSVTRREFYLGTLLTAALTSGILASIFVIGGFAEQATNGYGMNGYFFYLGWLWEAGWWAAWLAYFAIAMLLFVAGFWGATIYKRGGPLVLTIVLVGLGAVLVALMWLTGLADAWARVFSWIGAQGALGLTLWGMLLIAVLAASSFLTLRRAIP